MEQHPLGEGGLHDAHRPAPLVSWAFGITCRLPVCPPRAWSAAYSAKLVLHMQMHAE